MNDTDLTDIRTDRASLLTQLCTITRPAVDAGGLSTGVYATVATNVPCRVQHPGGGPSRALTSSGRTLSTLSVPGEVTIAFANSQDVQTGDLIVIAGSSYKVGIVHSEAPQNFGLTVDAQLQRTP